MPVLKLLVYIDFLFGGLNLRLIQAQVRVHQFDILDCKCLSRIDVERLVDFSDRSAADLLAHLPLDDLPQSGRLQGLRRFLYRQTGRLSRPLRLLELVFPCQWYFRCFLLRNLLHGLLLVAFLD